MDSFNGTDATWTRIPDASLLENVTTKIIISKMLKISDFERYKKQS